MPHSKDLDCEGAALIEKPTRNKGSSDTYHDAYGMLSNLTTIRRRIHLLIGLSATTIIALLIMIILQCLPAKDRTTTESISASTTQAPIWLIATMTPIESIARRQIIRSTWQKHAKLHPEIESQCVFFLGQPTHLWSPLILAENATYGDLIILPIEDTSYNANHFKTMVLFKHLRDTLHTAKSAYKFITKLDDDSYLSASDFHTRYLLPHWENPHLVIGRDMLSRNIGFQYPGGQMYTLSYPLALRLADLHDATPIRDEDEDVLIGRLLVDANETFEFVAMPNRDAFDVNEWDGNTEAWEHQVLEGAVNPHKLKTDQMYLEVAALFGVDGLDLEKVEKFYGREG